MIIEVSGVKIRVENAEEILRMGGPYVGDLYYNNDILIGQQCIVDSFVYRDDLNLLFYIQYHQNNKCQYFTINFRNLTNAKVFQFGKEFEMVHIGEFVSSVELEIFLAFHGKLPDRKKVFNIDDESFSEII